MHNSDMSTVCMELIHNTNNLHVLLLRIRTGVKTLQVIEK